MIYIYANGYGNNKGKALTFVVYQMKDFLIPKDISKDIGINVKVRKKSGAYMQKRLSVAGKADKFVEVIFPENKRFFRFGYRSKCGVSFNIPHSDLQEYVDDDCFIFDIVSDTQP